ncbi:hypothetical protein VTJ83DRAFT_386 [Remersonia thermophila]|uniref:SET domain-containing protein n=1 Tax=Remersonia thermophila TaxID=72144 RepID=A0ABR4DKX4_9PEZI
MGRVIAAADKTNGHLHVPGGENTRDKAQDKAIDGEHGNPDDLNTIVSHLSHCLREATQSGEVTSPASGFTSDAVDDENASENDLSGTPVTIPSSPNEPSHQAGITIWARMLMDMLDDLTIGPIAPPPSPTSLDPAVPNAPDLPTLSAFPSPARSSPSTRSTLSPAARAAVPSRTASPPPGLHQDQAKAPAAPMQDLPVIFRNEHFVVRRSSLGGLGAFAARDLCCGETILVEQPLLVTTSSSLLFDYHNLPEEAKQAYMTLHGADDGDPLHRIKRIMGYNA